MNSMVRNILAISLLLVTTAVAAEPMVLGTLQSSVERLGETKAAGVTLVTVGLSWDRYEPRRGAFDAAYVAKVRQKIEQFRSAGMKVMLDLGMQYPPAWAQELPNARYVDQHGEAYVDKSPGKNVLNGVFSPAVRAAQAAYVARIFKDLGTEFHAMRLGWNYYGELGYPGAKYKDHNNCYWGFDANTIAKPGDRPMLPPRPDPDWRPGQASNDHAAAKRFIDWYLQSLVNYQQWQIATVRKHYGGYLPVLIASWGIRQGMINEQVAKDLGDTQQTEMSLGYDYDRLVAAINDPKVIVYTTWIDSNPEFGDEAAKEPKRWSPVHYLAVRAAEHPMKLAVWGENTGGANLVAMELSFSRALEYKVGALVWAFEPELFDGKHASADDFKRLAAPRAGRVGR